MHRTQVLFDDDQFEALKALSRRERKSVGQLVREFVDSGLAYGRSGGKGGEKGTCSLEGILDDPGFDAGDHDQALYGKK